MLVAAVAALLLTGAPVAAADDVQQLPVAAEDIATQAVAAATPPAATEPVPEPEQPSAAPLAPTAAEAPPTTPAPTPQQPVPPPPAVHETPTAPSSPVNVNVSVRVGSEGDDGPVAQISDGTNVNVSVRVDSPGATEAVEQATSPSRPLAPATPAMQAQDGAAPTFVWHWTWTSACGLSAPGATPRGAIELDWQWSCDVPAPGPSMPGVSAVPALPAGVVPGTIPMPAVPFGPGTRGAAGAPDRGPKDAFAAAASEGPLLPLAPVQPLPAGAVVPVGAVLFTSRPAPSAAGGAAPRGARHSRDPRRPGPAPISPEIPLPAIAFVTTSPAGSTAAGALFLLAVGLLGVVALSGPSGPRLRLRAAINRLRSRAGRRLERPG